MNGAPVAQQLSVAPLNGTAASNQHQIKTMTTPVLGPQMRISSNGGLPIAIPVSQNSPASRAAIAMPHVDVQKPEVNVTPVVSNSAMPIPSYHWMVL
jgi:enhancer of polycomb-like protein